MNSAGNKPQEQSQLLQSMFDHATVGIIMTDAAGIIVKANIFAKRIFGYEDDNLIGQSIEILVPRNAHKRHVEYRDDYFQKPVPRPMGVGRELFGVKKNGEHFPVEISLSYAVQDNERLAIAFVSDTSVRKSMLASLRKNERELQEYSDRLEQKVMERTRELTSSEARLREAQRMASLGYWEYDLTNEELSTSEVLLDIFDLSSHTGLTPQSFLELLHPEDLPKANTVVRKAIMSINRHEYSYRILTKNSGTKYIQGYVEREIDRREGAIKLFGITQDVTTYKLAESQLALSLNKERELGELKSRFVAMASHEFRTPLTSILSSTDLIEIHAERMQTNRFERHLKRIKSSVNNLVTILNDFLSLEKLESGAIVYTPRQISVSDFFAQTLDDISLASDERQRITHQHEGSETVRLDTQLTRNIINNLVSNAIKYAPGNTPILIRSKRSEQTLSIEITDHGIGIPLADQANLFNRFFRASNAESIKGTGLGLNIVKRYVEIMSGSISFTSEEGKGTTFRIELPQLD
ncbi:hypothetical protein CEQ90_11785 [Lewinellaceae bacterium SD302]|nr:hypothetical protein CEQ90_11785 [Lewinellaceae bacterium SD302]